MVHACQKYGKCASSKVKDVAKHISDKDAEDFAKTKHKGLPEHKKKKSFKEWLQKFNEVGTSTADVAMFKVPVGDGGIVRRGYFGDDDFYEKLRKKRIHA